MTEMPGLPPDAARAEAAAQIAAQAADLGGSTDAGPTLEQIQAAQRAAILPYEQQLQAAMATMAAMQAQMKELQAGVTAAQQAAGPPAVEQYANGVATLIKAHADSSPDLGAGYFDGALQTAAALQAAATAAVTSQDPTEIHQLIGDVQGWISKFKGKHLDFSGVAADLELLTAAAAKLAAVV